MNSLLIYFVIILASIIASSGSRYHADCFRRLTPTKQKLIRIAFLGSAAIFFLLIEDERAFVIGAVLLPIMMVVQATNNAPSLYLSKFQSKMFIRLMQAIAFCAIVWLSVPMLCFRTFCCSGGSCAAENDGGQYNDKPVIYLYPAKPASIEVKLDFRGAFTFLYPKFNKQPNIWSVFAQPDGMLHLSGQKEKFHYLFWEGISTKTPNFDLSKGAVIAGAKIAEYLRDQLPRMGLISDEYNDFITYWGPRLQRYPLLQIYFAGSEYTDTAKLTISPKPDRLIRVFMVAKPLTTSVSLTPQVFNASPRDHKFTAVEWGGTVLNDSGMID